MQPGDVIDGKYEVELVVGEGGMGSVVAATHRVLGTTVAIKILKPEGARNPEVAGRFLREARAASRLRGEHVAQVQDIGTLPSGEPYMVMQMLHGADLASVIKSGPIAIGAAADYIIQACEGLAEAHALGMIHRDIKPGNLFLTQRPNGEPLVKVLDFGIATAAHGEVDRRLTMTNMVMGSPNYMSPEQLRSTRDVDVRSDVWSLGVTLYEMLSGKNPFEGPTFTALTIMIATEPHESLSMVAPELAAIVDRCLEKNPDNRYQNVAALAVALAPYADRTASGVSAALRIAGTQRSAVPPTLPPHPRSGQIEAIGTGAGLGGIAVRGSSPYRPPTTPPNPTTSQFTSGESVDGVVRVPSRKGWIIAGLLLGAAAVAAVVAFTVMHDDESAVRVATQTTSPPPPPKPEPKIEPKIEPRVEPIVEPAKTDAPVKAADPDPSPDAAHVQRAYKAFEHWQSDDALDEILAITDIHAVDTSKLVPYVDKLRRTKDSAKIRQVVALLELPAIKHVTVVHRPPPPPHATIAPPPPPPPPPSKGCSPNDPKCGL